MYKQTLNNQVTGWLVTFFTSWSTKKESQSSPNLYSKYYLLDSFWGGPTWTVAINSQAKWSTEYGFFEFCCTWVWDQKTNNNTCAKKSPTMANKKGLSPKTQTNKSCLTCSCYLDFVLLFLPLCMCTATLVSTLSHSVFVGATQNWTCLKISLLLVP